MTTPKTGVRAGQRIEYYLTDPAEIKELRARAKRSGLTVSQEARRLMLALMVLSDKPWDPQPPEDGNLGELMDGPWNKPR
jgi:hypothetical protein